MLLVLGALVPGTLAMAAVWGMGVLWNVAVSVLACAAVEALCVALRGASVRFHLRDGSATVAGWLMAIALPPWTELYVLLIAALGAMALAKHAYGGAGHNLFNPAMVGYALVLVSFPGAVDHWPPVSSTPDALTGATLLSEFRYGRGFTADEFAAIHASAMEQQLWIAGAFAAGGLCLVWTRVAHWRIPVAVFTGVIVAALFGSDAGSSEGHGGAWFHITTGGFVVAAFFVATDPMTHPRDPRHQLLFGVTIGVLIYLIRAFGAYPDGIAFAVLLANALTPLLNRMALARGQRTPGAVEP